MNREALALVWRITHDCCRAKLIPAGDTLLIFHTPDCKENEKARS